VVAEFAGRTAIVTGASRGIGKAVATLLAAHGASLVLVARHQNGLDLLASQLAATGTRVTTLAGDVCDPQVAEVVVACAGREFGGADVLANIAGAYPTALLAATTDQHYSSTMAVNLTSTFVMCRAVLPRMLARGSGSIVNMSSTAARLPTPGLSVYGASKAGVEAFTRAIAVEAAPHVRVNAVSAGPTLTEAVEALMASDRTGAVDTVTRSLPLQRLAQPAEIAEAVVFLASSRASFVTGQVLHANGGGFMA